MVTANIKVQKLFKRNLKDLHFENRLSTFEMEMILKSIQEAYDIGHADGYAEGVSEFYTDDN